MDVLLYGNRNSIYHLVIKPCTSSRYIVLTIFGGVGSPLFSSIPNCDFFEKQENAVEMIKQNFGSTLILEAERLIGIVRGNNDSFVIGLILSSRKCSSLPNNVEIKTVSEVAYVTISLSGYQIGSCYDDFPVSDFHYFCDTYNMSNCYPNDNDPYDPCKDFCWNRRWRTIFVEMGLGFLCVVLLQGMVETLNYGDYRIDYIVRRSVLNPGTRYFARGLNKDDAPGNEVECQLVFSKNDGKYWTHYWRRGSVPFYWETVLSVGTAKNYVHSNFCSGTLHYFWKLRKRFGDIQIFLVSLLHFSSKNPNAPENELYLQYQQTASELLKKGVEFVTFYPFDLNEKFQTEGENAIYDLLSYLSPLALLSDFTTNETKQKGMIRVNCADSLDRTNLATFYYAMIITAEWSRRVGLSSNDEPLFSPNHPQDSIPAEILDFLAKAFVKSGDIISILYTNTPSIKTFQIRKFSKSLGSQYSDARISVKRRFNNVFSDPQRHEKIMKWTTITNQIHKTFFLDFLHFNVLFDNTSSILFSLTDSKIKPINLRTNTFTIVLQLGYYLTNVWIYQFPSSESTRITINNEFVIDLPGVSNQGWYKYKIPPNTYRIINFIFENINIYIGKICFECTDSSFTIPKIINETPSFNLDQCRSMALNIIKQLDFISLTRFQEILSNLNISDDKFEKICLSLQINPWLFNPGRFLNEHKKCLICLKSCDSKSNNSSFFRSQYFPSKLSFFASRFNHKKIPICSKCTEAALKTANATTLLEEKVQKSKIFKNQFDYSDYDFNKTHNLAVLPYSMFIKENSSVNSILQPNGYWKHTGNFSYILLLGYNSLIEEISLLLKSEPNCDFTFSIEIKNIFQIIDLSKNGLLYTFKVQTPFISSRIHFFLSSTLGIEIEQIFVYGRPMLQELNRNIVEYQNLPKEKDIPKTSFISYQWNLQTKTQIISMKGEPLPINIAIQQEKLAFNEYIIAFYYQENLQNSFHFVTPTMFESSRLFYRIKNDKPFDSVYIYHIDFQNSEQSSPISVSITQ